MVASCDFDEPGRGGTDLRNRARNLAQRRPGSDPDAQFTEVILILTVEHRGVTRSCCGALASLLSMGTPPG